MWKALYDSPFWLPILPSLIALGLVGAALRGTFVRSRILTCFAVGTALLAAADGWLGGPWSPLAPDSAAATAAGVFFVIAGDLRYFLATRLGKVSPARALSRATALAFVMPLVSQLAVRVPFPQAPARVVYFTYELGMIVVVLLDALRAPRDAASRALLRYELVQYALWATADLVLLAGIESGYGLRIVPNVLYYAGFVPFAASVVRARFPATPPASE